MKKTKILPNYLYGQYNVNVYVKIIVKKIAIYLGRDNGRASFG